MLVAVSAAARARRTSDRKAQRPTRETLDFSLPVRAFMKRHARRLGGPQKFTALLARLTMGEVGVAKSFKEIKNTWNRMTEPMGGRFNPAYTTRAKDSGWVDTPKTGFYGLRPDWASALGKK